MISFPKKESNSKISDLKKMIPFITNNHHPSPNPIEMKKIQNKKKDNANQFNRKKLIRFRSKCFIFLFSPDPIDSDW